MHSPNRCSRREATGPYYSPAIDFVILTREWCPLDTYHCSSVTNGPIHQPPPAPNPQPTSSRDVTDSQYPADPSIKMSPQTGAAIIAQTLSALNVLVIFGIVGIPVVDIAEEALKVGIRFIGFRNEQAASYAATAYGYLTQRPGVCLVVGGPGVLHAVPGVGNATANGWPMLLLAGSCETGMVGKGAFQELDAVAFLKPHTIAASRPRSITDIAATIAEAYGAATRSVPGPMFVDLPADLIQGTSEVVTPGVRAPIPPQPSPQPINPDTVLEIAHLIRHAQAPLLILGKGAAHSHASQALSTLISATSIPFLPTPMGKGVVPDSHPLNTSAARSAALKHADLVLLFGARLNWILHFGEPPKWNPSVKFVSIDIDPQELLRNRAAPALGILGDAGEAATLLTAALGGWRFPLHSSPYWSALQTSKSQNEQRAAAKLLPPLSLPMSYATAFSVIRSSLHAFSPSSAGRIVYISEGANTMDISRSLFPVEHPRLRLDAGTHATMGVGLGYAIAAHAAYNPPAGQAAHASSGPCTGQRKKIVCFEGDSAFGFSAMEVETMARYGMDVLVFVLNNGGIYHGDADERGDWEKLRDAPGAGAGAGSGAGLRSTSLGFETRYEMLAEACSDGRERRGWMVRTPEELEVATREALLVTDGPCVVNVIIESGKGGKLEFGWQAAGKQKQKQAQVATKL